MFDLTAYRRTRRADPEYRQRELDRDAATTRARRKKNPAKFRVWDAAAYKKHKLMWQKRSLKRHYGIAFSEWKVMLAAQQFRCANSACAVAALPGDFSMDGWHTDHDHKTGMVRGVLCPECNRALGCVDDDPNRLQGLTAYLEDRKQPNAST